MSCRLRFQSARVPCHGPCWRKAHGLITRSSLGIAFAVMTLVFAVGVVRGDDGLTKTLPIGTSAPDFTLPGIDGRNHSLQDYADARILVIIFTANHCKTAQAYEGRIIQLVKDYKDKGVVVVGIAPNDP